MKGDGRARTLMKLLEELPEGVSITKNADPRQPLLSDNLEDPAYLAWLKELDTVLQPSQEEAAYDLSGLPAPPEYTAPEPGSVWEVSYYDEYGETFEDTCVTLAESRDLIKALLLAKNRLRSGRALFGS